MEYLLSEVLFNELFLAKILSFNEKAGDDYQYIRLNQAARALFPNEANGKMLSTLTSSRNFTTIQENYNRAITMHSQVDYVDYAYFKSEVRKYETSVRPLKYNKEDYILAITKEIVYNCSSEDKFFLRSMLDHAFFSTVILSDDGTVFEVNSSFIEDFKLDAESVKHQLFVDLPFVPKEEVQNIQNYIQRAAMGENIGKNRLNFIHWIKRAQVFSFIISCRRGR